ncbi:patatin-like phospholipase family protein [Reichenbachiella sp. MSK19-1]|uniref:patatin-like phospholipase family protein n=1 Tax=Reichenbachiella sp. MSK19-1 TaxID=1897631 RepID=UPI000E6BFA04|nr:patatin-like phospholipase family protein [Reichenbachiella sp. MSK19-1]
MKRSMLDNFIFSFPVQLFAQYFKSHQILLIAWVLLFLFITGSSGNVMGIPYVFLDPEYLHEVSFWSFFIVGIGFGILTVSFHITGYILHANKYRFVGLLKKPFSNFSVNNSVIPLCILILYTVAICIFQSKDEHNTGFTIFTFLAGFYLGLILITALLYGYFRLTNKNIYAYITRKLNARLKLIKLSRINILDRLSNRKKRKVTSFIGLNLRIHDTKELYQFPNKKIITRVFDQNHLNSVILVVILTGLILLMGRGIDYSIFQLPAAASLMVLFGMITMAVGALAYWTKEWLVAAFFGVYIIFNILFTTGIILDYHEAFGLNYDTVPANYTISKLYQQSTDSIIAHDKRKMIQVLNQWKQKQKTDDPVAVFVCVSGGGSRSALWAHAVLGQIDQRMKEPLMDQTVLITGASGGMVGASFYRELSYQRQLGLISDPNSDIYLDQIARDNLNPMIFNLVVNDLFLHNPRFEYARHTYSKDRGFAFEQQLHTNTNFVMDKKLSDYGALEAQAKIPMILFGSTVMNDGRKLYISDFNTAFMNTSPRRKTGINEPIIDVIDFQRFFQNQGAKDIRYTSALRMNASFPYITPSISLPSDPTIKVMDAGVTDNFGVTDAVRFIYAFKDWLAENTSSVVLITIRDTKRVQVIEPQPHQSIFDKVSNPISSVYNNLANFQDVNNAYKLEYMKSWYPDSIHQFVLEYDMYEDYREENDHKGVSTKDSTKAKRPSLNWHLTEKEKKSLIRNVQSKSKQSTIHDLVDRLSQGGNNHHQ